MPQNKTVFVTFADAFAGGVIGLLFAYVCYRQHYPPFLHTDCHLPYASLAAAADRPSHPAEDLQPTDNATTLPLEGLTEGPVWLVATTETPPKTLTKPPSPPPLSQWLTQQWTVTLLCPYPLPSLGGTQLLVFLLLLISISDLFPARLRSIFGSDVCRNLKTWHITPWRETSKPVRTRPARGQNLYQLQCVTGSANANSLCCLQHWVVKTENSKPDKMSQKYKHKVKPEAYWIS